MTPYRYNVQTHVGLRRKVNEDAVLALPDHNIWAVSDGMGGHDAGDLASRLITDAIAMIPAGLAPTDRMHALRDRMSVSQYLHDMAKPTIAAIEGSCAGAGLSMALSCDLRICAKDAKITTAFAKVGLSGDYGGTYFMTQILGAAKARELYLTSPVLSGQQAADIGLVTRAVPAAEVFETARALAAGLAAGPTLTLGRIKQNIALAESGGSLADCFAQEARNHMLSSTTADHREAAAAFVEKRKPVFSGS